MWARSNFHIRGYSAIPRFFAPVPVGRCVQSGLPGKLQGRFPVTRCWKLVTAAGPADRKWSRQIRRRSGVAWPPAKLQTIAPLARIVTLDGRRDVPLAETGRILRQSGSILFLSRGIQSQTASPVKIDHPFVSFALPGIRCVVTPHEFPEWLSDKFRLFVSLWAN